MARAALTLGVVGVIVVAMWRFLPLLAALACRPDKDVVLESPEDSEPESPADDSTSQDLGFDLIYSAAEDQLVRRVSVPGEHGSLSPELLEERWIWRVADTWTGLEHKPHGLMDDNGRLLVAVLDYFTDAGVLALDRESGAVLEVLKAPQGVSWGGSPSPETLRFTHNTIRDGDLFISSDTHNQRVLATDAAWNPVWILSRESVGDADLRARFSQPNDVERITVNGEERLLVSTRGDFCNFVLLFAPATPLRPHDPPWRLLSRYPAEANASVLLENHNPRPLPDGSGFSVADSGHDRILGVSWDGEVLWSLPDPSCPSSVLDWPRDAVFTPAGTLLVGDTLHDRIVELDPAISCPSEDDIVWQIPDIREPYQLMVIPHEESP